MTEVRLDTASDPWVGTVPGLGRVLVGADGHIDVELEPAPGLHDEHHHDEIEQRTASLRHGWGAALSYVRRGWSIVFGAGLVDPNGRCLVTVGHPDGTAAIASRLEALGWAVLAEQVQPVSWSGPPGKEHLVAHPGTAPVVVGRRHARQHGLVGTPVRADSDVVVVPLRRHESSLPVTAFVHVREHRSRLPEFANLTGHERFDRCTNLLAGSTIARGGITPPVDPAAHLAEALRLARLPHATMTHRTADTGESDTGESDPLAALLTWWNDLAAPSGST